VTHLGRVPSKSLILLPPPPGRRTPPSGFALAALRDDPRRNAETLLAEGFSVGAVFELTTRGARDTVRPHA
jgi:hypothetical protein